MFAIYCSARVRGARYISTRPDLLQMIVQSPLKLDKGVHKGRRQSLEDVGKAQTLCEEGWHQ